MTILNWIADKLVPIYNKLKSSYQSGDLSAEHAAVMLCQLCSYSPEDAVAEVKAWHKEHPPLWNKTSQ